MIRVTAVQPESIAEELGLAVGTELLAVNGRELEDFLDWEFLTADEEFVLHVRQPDGEEIEFEIERPLGEPFGVGLEPARIRRCANRCDFCFVDGLPDGLRDVLYIRDDDYRLSFRYGNFATLTNLKPRDVERIIEYRLSPLYVSVHATDPTVRRYLLRNPTAPDILPQLRAVRRSRDRVPDPGRDVAGRERRTRAGADPARAVPVRPLDPGLLGGAGRPHRVQQAPPGARADRGGMPRRDRVWWRRARPRRSRSAASTGPSAPTSSTCGRGSRCRPPRSTTASIRSRTASAACAGCSGRSRAAPRPCTDGRAARSAW